MRTPRSAYLGAWWVGVCLAGLQVVVMTGLGPVFHSSELPYQLASLALILGHALGYRLSARWAAVLMLPCCAVPVLLLGLRVLLPDTETSSWRSLALAVGLIVLATASLAARTLYWWSRCPGRERPQLVRLYSCELVGAFFGLGLAVAAGPMGMLRLFPALVCVAAWPSRAGAALLLPLALLQALWLPWAALRTSQVVHARTLPGARILSSHFSPYQLVEAVEFNGEPYLFLNGLCHHNPQNLVILNYYLSALPAHLLTPEVARQGALVLGGGAMMSAVETCRAGLHTTVVELDPEVLRVSLTEFAPRFGLTTANPLLDPVCSDARSFTRRTARQYGLIVFSLPYPYSLNVASLFTREYFRELRTRLAPGGTLAVFLGSAVQRGPKLDPVAAKFLRALYEEFPYLVGVTGREVENTIVLCRTDSEWDLRQVHRQCRSDGFFRFHLLDSQQLLNLCATAEPSTLWDLSACARLNRDLWR